jgi:SAM-dependent methyltransferase
MGAGELQAVQGVETISDISHEIALPAVPHVPALKEVFPARGLGDVVVLRDLLLGCEDHTALSPDLIRGSLEHGGWYHVTPFRSALIRSLQIPSGARILEVGCGGGALTRYLGEQGYEVVGLEIDPEVVECARLRCKGLSNVEIVHGYLEDVLHFSRFDFVICIDPTFVRSDYYEPGLQLLSLCKRLLKTTGTLVLALGNPLHAPGGAHVEPSPDHVRGVGTHLESLRQSLFGAGFVDFQPLMTFPHHAAPRLIVEPKVAREHRIDWLRYLKDFYQASESSERELEGWWQAIYDEQLEVAFAPGWLILAHAHQVRSITWDGWGAKAFEVNAHEGKEVTSSMQDGVVIHGMPLGCENLVRSVMRSSKPTLSSVQDYKHSLMAADDRIETLEVREASLKDNLAESQRRFSAALFHEQEARRVREAELDLVLKQYHSVGSMCHDMRAEGKKLQTMVDDLSKRYAASEAWAAALASRIGESEAELAEVKSSRSWRLVSVLRRFLKRSG